MDWMPAPDALVELVEDEFKEPMNEVRYARLPFYEDGYLVEAATDEYRLHAAFGGMAGLAIVSLDGQGVQIKLANRMCGLAITRDNVAEYVKFFCGHLLAPVGEPYEIVEDCGGKVLDNGHRLRDMRLKVRHEDSDGAFRVGAYQLLGGRVFRVSFRVPLDGNIEMLRDLKLGDLASVN